MSRRCAPAQLGLDTVLVEGGRSAALVSCGCIPSKALIHAADRFADAANTSAIGITAAPKLDLSKTVAWKDGIVDRLNSGVAGLLARARCSRGRLGGL